MTDPKELEYFITRARAEGANVKVIYNDAIYKSEGRRIIDTIQVSGIRGIGPNPMGPIAAAEAFRRVFAYLDAPITLKERLSGIQRSLNRA